MDKFNLKTYLAEGKLLKEELTPLQQYVYDYEKEVSGEDNAKEFLDGIKKLNTPNDVYDYYAFERNWEGDSDLEGDLENIYNQVLDKFKSKNENKMDNFDLKKYLAEGKLHEAINLDIEDDIAILSGDLGEYEGEIEDGKTSFSIIYDDLDYRISDQYNENNIEDFLGKGHAFVELAKKYDHKWGIERDLVGITIKLNG